MEYLFGSRLVMTFLVVFLGSMFIDENKALSFLQQQTQTNHRRRRSTTDVVEECCLEGCSPKEVYKYCVEVQN